jgi:RNA polymerase sigma-70 factor (ECF subfamily)
MRRFAHGDTAAFEELYRRYERPVYSFCLHLLGDPDRAQDAFQEAFIRVVDGRENYRSQGRFRNWLFTIARHACADQARDAGRSSSDLGEPQGAESQSAGPAAEGRVVARDELGRALALLPREQREVVLLSRYHGFSYREIADLTGSTEAAVKQKAYRALKTLRAALSTEEGGG